MTQPRIEADERSEQFIRERGGRFYIWASQAGIEHAATNPPDSVKFREYAGGGFTLFVDHDIAEAHIWRLEFRRFPQPHVRALWNAGAFSPSGARVSSWERERPWE